MNDLRHWHQTTRHLGKAIDTAVLSEIARRGYTDLKRGAGIVDEFRLYGDLLLYMATFRIQQVLEPERWAAIAPTLETYNPNQEMVVIVFSPLPCSPDLVQINSFLIDLRLPLTARLRRI